MKMCRFCGCPIMEFTFKEGKQWWHLAATGYRHCHMDPRMPVAAP